MDPDDLFTLRNLLYIGNYEAALAEASSIEVSDRKLQAEKEYLVQRAQVAAGNAKDVAQELQSRAKEEGNLLIELQAALLLANSEAESEPQEQQQVMKKLQELANNPETAGNPVVQLVGGIIYANMGELNAALRAISHGNTLEIQALRVQLYLRMDRTDLAARELEAMKQVDEDATLSQLASAWVNIAQGGDQYSEAAFVFREQMEKWQTSDMLVNGLAVALMHMEKLEEAETVLFESVADRPPSSMTLANLIVVSTKLQRGQSKIDKLIEQLRVKDPSHVLLTDISKMDSAFDRAASTFSP